MTTANKKGGIKYDSEKPMLDLLDAKFLEGVGRVLTIGAVKYAPYNWKKIKARRYVAAAMRHWLAYMGGERFDKETGESHLYHLACCLMFLDYFDRQ